MCVSIQKREKMVDKEAKSKEYKAENIRVLEGLEGVRHRPAMYIGSTSKTGLHHLVWELMDNSIDEAMGGHCDLIEVTINKDGSLTVKDNGRGIPVDIHPVYKRPALEVAVTKLHAGGKFDKSNYKFSGGLHGVGISVVAALSKLMKIVVKKGGKIYQQEYKIGKPLYDMKTLGDCPKDDTGTEVTFMPDETIFSTTKFDFSTIHSRFKEMAFLNKGLKIILEDEESKKKEVLHYEGGLIEFVKELNKSKEEIHKPIYFFKEQDKLEVECAVQYNASYYENVLSFVNTVNTTEGGTHVVGFKTALTRAINDYANKNKMNKGENLTGDDVREGLTAVVSVKIAEPQFEGQTKTKLGDADVKGIVDGIATTALTIFFEENPTIARRIVDKSMEAQKARNAAKKAKELVRRKNAFSVGGLPGKLADCSSNKMEESELYIVEGDSAGGCFSGETKVALADGRQISFKELSEEDSKGKKNFGYTIENYGSIGICQILHPRVTKKDVEVIKIILDNNEEIICTPDHKFMLRNGSYKEAQHLKTDDSLMPFHRRISKLGGRITIEGYEMIWDPQKMWVFTHLLADQYNLKRKVYLPEQGDTRHHIDFNKRNNNPTNIIRLTKEEHLSLHNENLIKTLHRPDVKEKSIIAHQSPEYRKKMSEWAQQPQVKEVLSNNAKKQWSNPKYKQFMTQKFIEFYNTNEDYRKQNNEQLNKSQKEYWSNLEHKQKASEKVKRFFEQNPDAKEYLSEIAKKQWTDEELIIWRRQKTKEQWTPEFRKQRKESYNKTYYLKTISLMKQILENRGNLEEFDKIRVQNRDKSILSQKEFCKRFFNNDAISMQETVVHWNHKIRKIEKLTQRMSVYDLEVPETHNFALASGIFVHNSAKQARNKEHQAILPIKGKILNVEKANPIKVFSHEEIANLITASGCGVGDQFDVAKLRYAKIIIMTDADVDGAHIRTLLLTFFFRFMPKLIEQGNIFIAVPPLYRIRKRGDHYVYSDEELKKLVSKLSGNVDVQRFKGLGEMNPEQLWDTTMDPKTRLLKKVTIDDAALADSVFVRLMGDDVEPRKQFIAEHASEAQIDI